jgi:hypothetical protein
VPDPGRHQGVVPGDPQPGEHIGERDNLSPIIPLPCKNFTRLMHAGSLTELTQPDFLTSIFIRQRGQRGEQRENRTEDRTEGQVKS